MARIDRRRLDGSTFPLISTVQTRFDDIDVHGHVNNAAAAVILQEARVALSRAVRLPEIQADLRVVVAALSIEYAREMHHPEPIEVSTGVLLIGHSSVTIGQLARQGGDAALYAETVLVLTNSAGPATMPQSLREAYAAFLIRPK